MKYVIFDENGFPKAFYSPDIHGDNIPEEAIEITEEQWLEFINNQGRRRWDFEKKEVVEYVPPPPSVEELRTMIDNQRKRKVSNLLSKTDYILLKLQEAQAVGNETEYQNLLQTYANEIQQRRKIREWNNDIEQKIQSATTIEELEAIRKEIAEYNPNEA